MKNSNSKKWFKSGTRFAIVPSTLLLDQNLSNTEKLILVALALHHNHKTGTCTPSRSTISKICGGLSPNKISESITKLKKSGWLDTKRRGSISNQYILHEPQSLEEIKEINTPPDKPHQFQSFNNFDSDFYDEDEPY